MNVYMYDFLDTLIKYFQTNADFCEGFEVSRALSCCIVSFIFHSFEAVINNATSSFKRLNIFLLMKNTHVQI